MALDLLRLAAVLCLLFAVGYLAAERLLYERLTVARIGLAAAFGPALFLVLANGLGFVIPGTNAFIVTTVLFIITLVVLLRLPRIAADPSNPPRAWWIVGIVVTVLAGWATARMLNSDPWTWGQLSVAATVAAGNVPVHEPINPWGMLAYHYGPQFLAGAWTWLSGASVAATYDVQPFLCALGGLCMAAALAYRITKSWLAAGVAALLAFGASGFQWIYGAAFIADLVRIVSGQHIAYPLQHFNDFFSNSWGPSLFMMFPSRGYTFAFPFAFATLYALHEAVRSAEKRLVVLWSVAEIVLAAALALTTESSLVLLPPAAIAAALLLALGRGDSSWKRLIVITLLMFVPAAIISAIQGGVLTSILHGSSLSAPSFVLNDGRLQSMVPVGPRIGFWQPEILIAGGLPLVLLPFSWFVAWRKRREMPFLLLLCAYATAHILITLLVRYDPRPNEMLRFMHMGLTLSAFTLGITLLPFYASHARKIRIAGLAMLATMLLSSTVALAARLAFPTMRLEAAPVLATMPAITDEQAKLYAWVRDNTSLSDYFFQRTQRYGPFDPKSAGMTEEELQQRERILFMTYTGRFSVGFLHWGEITPEHRASAEDLDDRCSSASADALEIRYFLIESKERLEWFARQCDHNAWALAYDGGTPENPLKVYERRR